MRRATYKTLQAGRRPMHSAPAVGAPEPDVQVPPAVVAAGEGWVEWYRRSSPLSRQIIEILAPLDDADQRKAYLVIAQALRTGKLRRASHA